MRIGAALLSGWIALAAALVPGSIGRAGASDRPQRVTFASADGKTTLVGWLFRPARMPAARVPAVVMMHGRAGAYSSRAGGVWDASTLSQRHAMWGEFRAAIRRAFPGSATTVARPSSTR